MSEFYCWDKEFNELSVRFVEGNILWSEEGDVFELVTDGSLENEVLVEDVLVTGWEPEVP